MEAFGLLLHGFAVLLTWKTLALMMVGLVLGIFVGVLPGLGGPNGVAILLPLTFTMDPTSAIVMLSCIYWGALFGGAITSILFNIPGEAWQGGGSADRGLHLVVHRLAGRGAADHVPRAGNRLLRVALRTARVLRGLLTDLLLVRRARARGEAQDHHLHDARPAARRGRHGHCLRPAAHDLRVERAPARHQLPGRGHRPVRHQRDPADDGGAAGAARPCRQHQPAGGTESLEGAAALLGDSAALLSDRMLARHHAGRSDRRLLHGLQPRQALRQG